MKSYGDQETDRKAKQGADAQAEYQAEGRPSIRPSIRNRERYCIIGASNSLQEKIQLFDRPARKGT